MNKRKMYLLSILVIGVLTLAACGGGSDSAAGGNDSSSVKAGENVVKQSCVACHGADLKGGSATGLYGLNLSKDEIIDVVTNGKPGMPGGLAKGKEAAVAEYLLTLR